MKQITTSNQIVESGRDRRIAKSMVVAMSCEITQVGDRETYKVQSENDVNKYYIVKFKNGAPVYCSCRF